MQTAEARIETARASRYLVQFCRHASQMGQHLHHRPRLHQGGGAPPEMRHVEWSDTHGIVDVGWGRCMLQAAPDALTLRAEATDEDNLRRLQDLVAQRLETIGRHDQLIVTWQRPDAPTAQPGAAAGTAPTPTGQATAHRGHGRAIGLAAVAALAVAAHLGLVGAALGAARWLDWGANIGVAAVIVVVIVLGVKVAILGRLAKRRGPGHLAIHRAHRRTGP